MTEEVSFQSRISKISEEAEGVKSFVLERVDGTAWPDWAPGAHADLALGNQLGRQYSLLGDPADRQHLRIAVLREPVSRGGSALLHEGVREGDLVEVVALRNHFPLVDGLHYRLVAGGIGITPLLAMVHELERRGADWQLLYGGRTRASMAFLDELAVYGDKVVVRPQAEFGLLDLATFLGAPETGKTAYCCGPEALIQAVEAHCTGWNEDSLQIERFRPRLLETVPTAASFDVELRKSSITVTVPAGKSIADALDEVGVHIPRSCNEGTCGTCITNVLEGVPDHRDSFLRPKQRTLNNKILVCCSRSLSPRLVLDA